MHDALFAAAARPARFSILGLPMKPYSIGHEILLLEQGNALLYQGFENLPAGEQRKAIIRAALICSQGWMANQKPHRWLSFWHWKNRKANYALAIADFKNYRTVGSIFPPVPSEEVKNMISAMSGENPNKGRELGSPYLARLYNFVTGIGYSEIRIHGETAFDFPMALGNFLYLTNLESLGDMRIENAKEQEVKSDMEKIRADVVADNQKEAKCQP